VIEVTTGMRTERHYLFIAMFPIKPSGRPLALAYELQHPRLALYRLGTVSATNSPTIADLHRLLALRINKLESTVHENERAEA
jgi:predicted cation transporter